MNVKACFSLSTCSMYLLSNNNKQGHASKAFLPRSKVPWSKRGSKSYRLWSGTANPNKMLQTLKQNPRCASWSQVDWFRKQNGLIPEAKWIASWSKISGMGGSVEGGMLQEAKYNDSWSKMEWFPKHLCWKHSRIKMDCFRNQNGMILEAKKGMFLKHNLLIQQFYLIIFI